MALGKIFHVALVAVAVASGCLANKLDNDAAGLFEPAHFLRLLKNADSTAENKEALEGVDEWLQEVFQTLMETEGTAPEDAPRRRLIADLLRGESKAASDSGTESPEMFLRNIESQLSSPEMASAALEKIKVFAESSPISVLRNIASEIIPGLIETYENFSAFLIQMQREEFFRKAMDERDIESNFVKYFGKGEEVGISEAESLVEELLSMKKYNFTKETAEPLAMQPAYRTTIEEFELRNETFGNIYGSKMPEPNREMLSCNAAKAPSDVQWDIMKERLQIPIMMGAANYTIEAWKVKQAYELSFLWNLDIWRENCTRYIRRFIDSPVGKNQSRDDADTLRAWTPEMLGPMDDKMEVLTQVTAAPLAELFEDVIRDGFTIAEDEKNDLNLFIYLARAGNDFNTADAVERLLGAPRNTESFSSNDFLRFLQETGTNRWDMNEHRLTSSLAKGHSTAQLMAKLLPEVVQDVFGVALLERLVLSLLQQFLPLADTRLMTNVLRSVAGKGMKAQLNVTLEEMDQSVAQMPEKLAEMFRIVAPTELNCCTPELCTDVDEGRMIDAS